MAMYPCTRGSAQILLLLGVAWDTPLIAAPDSSQDPHFVPSREGILPIAPWPSNIYQNKPLYTLNGIAL